VENRKFSVIINDGESRRKFEGFYLSSAVGCSAVVESGARTEPLRYCATALVTNTLITNDKPKPKPTSDNLRHRLRNLFLGNNGNNSIITWSKKNNVFHDNFCAEDLGAFGAVPASGF